MLKFLFVQHENENIGVEYISAALKSVGHSVELAFFPLGSNLQAENQAIIKKIEKYKPDFACFSPFSFQFPWSLAKAKLIKENYPELFILFGGVHVNSVPDVVMEEKAIDGILLGEADKTIIEFAQNHEAGDITKTRSLWYRKDGGIVKNPTAPLETDLDALPYPDKDLFYNSPLDPIKRNMAYTAVGSRGCPFACTYCSNNVYQKLYLGQKRFRHRSPENVIGELEMNLAKYHYPRVEFADDVLAIDIERLRKLMDLYKEKVNVPFACFFHPRLVNEETVKILKEGGCTWFKLGVQSANENYRKTFLNRHETNEQILKVSELCRKYSLQFSFDHIFNLPAETKEHLIEAVNLYNECRPTIINFWGLMYLPGTDIIQTAIKHGSISEADVPAINTGQHDLSKLNLVPWYDNKNAQINTSAFMLLFVLISLLPKGIIDWLMKIKFYDVKFQIPNIVLVPLKVLSKIKAGQGYLYYSEILGYFIYSYQKINRAITRIWKIAPTQN
ncbi:hypothetical protein A2380_00620 [candidate division WWE3 bacterium RIFOXYB1_FULL_43_24]|uniref:Cobalamin B12-binding domain protein n=2 Tax=Katanobacteria TaxID=422282 RepID=A0A0G1AYR4_UNCKA|nr:MAG: Cobalamin B12-binding domain protein [candidate division WWE3 bacterium GW2011_GWA1_42_12]KKS33653.1 MAG: Cobalamin B12-binding domain protein [candidate division WWE3 bacterium GW2011_GWD1_42_14]KKS39221.1 MAG: Cobalamin B12-binding domain protein [candidate division WWE3 bacterium GW2011_GWF1_42_14]KKS40719.1 MAG: Cobalamin B12-binding domain protein [candidate division WWE3 bacterium GW2011_GWE1_42_16]KKS66874.1 MAG: Cobalamin B12-binding domain protein [candidate division WWE3 bacte